jgi:hypothetical protein
MRDLNNDEGEEDITMVIATQPSQGFQRRMTVPKPLLHKNGISSQTESPEDRRKREQPMV